MKAVKPLNRIGITPLEACKKHIGAPLYEVYVHNIENRSYVCYMCRETGDVYLTIEDAKKAARKVADSIAWGEQCRTVDDPSYDTEAQIYLVCILAGRRVSKKGTIYGCRKIIYAISAQTKEATERKTMDKRYNGLQIDEYTEQPVLTKDMFYQWPD